jgi:hypothetical protein
VVLLTDSTVSGNATGGGAGGGGCEGLGCESGWGGDGGHGGGVYNEYLDEGVPFDGRVLGSPIRDERSGSASNDLASGAVVVVTNSTVSDNTTGDGSAGGPCTGNNCWAGDGGWGGPGGGICNEALDSGRIDWTAGEIGSQASDANAQNGLLYDAVVFLTHSTVSGNTAGTGGAGGGCQGDSCHAGYGGDGGYGGGACSRTGFWDFFGPIIRSNRGALSPSAVDAPAQDGLDAAAFVEMTNSTVSGNSAGDATAGGDCDGAGCYSGWGGWGGAGGGIFNGPSVAASAPLRREGRAASPKRDVALSNSFLLLPSDVDLVHVTVSENVAGSGALGGACTGDACVAGSDGVDGYGGGLFEVFDLTTRIENTLVGGNAVVGSGLGPDCFGFVRSEDYNLIEDDSDCVILGGATHDITGTVPLLGALALNPPGDTETHALLAGSPAIDYIPPISCTVATDQRGVSRPQGDTCDIGAFEVRRGQIVVEKQTVPDGTAGDFTFEDDIEAPFTFVLTDGAQRTFEDVISGTYTIAETELSPGFELIDVTCSDGDSVGDPETGVATVRLQRGEVVTCIFTNELPRPDGESTDAVGVGQDLYYTDETVYATGFDFIPNTDVDIYVVPDRAWTDGDPIVGDVTGAVETVPTDGAGNLGPVDVWLPLLTPGDYDMVFDANQNGQYDAAYDVVDDPNHPGLVVRDRPVGGVTLPASGVTLLGPWLLLVGVVGVAVLVVLSRRR